MKNKRVNTKTIIIIVLIGIIGTLIGLNFNNKNTNIEKKIENAEQLTETTENNAYVSMATHLSEVDNAGNSEVSKLAQKKNFTSFSYTATEDFNIIVVYTYTAVTANGGGNYDMAITLTKKPSDFTCVANKVAYSDYAVAAGTMNSSWESTNMVMYIWKGKIAEGETISATGQGYNFMGVYGW